MNMYDWYEKMDAQVWEDRANAAYKCDVCGKIVDSVEEYDVDGTMACSHCFALREEE